MGGAPPSPLGSGVPGEAGREGAAVRGGDPAVSLSVRAARLRAGSRSLRGRSTSVTPGPQNPGYSPEQNQGLPRREQAVRGGFGIYFLLPNKSFCPTRLVGKVKPTASIRV